MLFVLLSGNDEVSSIQNQLNSLKLNPYPELKVVNEGNETSPTNAANQQSSSSFDDGPSSTLNAKEISNCLSDVELVGSSSPESSTYQQLPHASPAYPQRQQPQLDTATRAYQQQQLCQNGETVAFNAQQQQLQQHQSQQFLAQSQQQSIHSQDYQNGINQQHDMQPTNMAIQFMQAMQQSVSQVANAPHFGYEWVKPNYQFDPLTTFLDSEPSQHGKPLLKGSTLSETPPLTERDMNELYEVLDEYPGKDMIEERILQAPNVHQHLYHE